MAEVINRALPWCGSAQRAFAWYGSQPIPAFRDQTTESLVRRGQAKYVLNYLGGSRLAGTRQIKVDGVSRAPSRMGVRIGFRGGSRADQGPIQSAPGRCALHVRSETAWLEAQRTILPAHGITPQGLACVWKDLKTRGIEPLSGPVADHLTKTGIAAIIVPSYASGATIPDTDVVFWTWDSSPLHRAQAIDDERRLPKDARSWR